MVYIYNKYISPKKTINIALTNIYGIGKKRALDITKMLGINPNIRFGKITKTQLSKITKYISKEYIVGSFLRQEVTENIKKYIKIRHYKGLRHRMKLPVRGQRTHTNAQTRKNSKINIV